MAKVKSTKAKRKVGSKGGSREDEAPLTMEEVLKKEDQPASEPVPPEIAAKLAQHRIVVSSAARDFDPREHWKKIKGSTGAWELVTPEPVTSGLPVERMERFEPESLGGIRDANRDVAPWRPPWQPFIYHPKRALALAGKTAARTMRRKNGTKVRPLTVFNHDDREVFVPLGYPWHCVGKLTVMTANGATYAGAGTLVGKRTVLTAEHVVPWGSWGQGASILFQPGYFAPSLRLIMGFGPPIQSWVTDAWGFVNSLKNGNPGRDIATLRLAEPLGEWLGTFGARVYDDDWEDDPRWTLIGYPNLVGVTSTFSPPSITGTAINGEFPTRQFGISVEDDDEDGSGLELEIYADATPGNSGGPLFGHWEKGPYIIGVLSGEELSTIISGGTNIAAGGNAMMRLVHRALALWG